MRSDIKDLQQGQEEMRSDIKDLQQEQKEMRKEQKMMKQDIEELQVGQKELRQGQRNLEKSMYRIEQQRIIDSNNIAKILLLQTRMQQTLEQHIQDDEMKIAN